jgi:hypothetical protein
VARSNRKGRAYSHWVAPFVEHLAGTAQAVELGPVAAIDVTGFLTAYLPGLSRKSAQMTACFLRSFLRFLHSQGMVEVSLADTVPLLRSPGKGCRSTTLS